MRSRDLWITVLILISPGLSMRAVEAGTLTYSHSSSALPGATGPAITLLSITGVNDGTNFTFTLTFANPTIEGPSSGNDDAVFGFISLDTDKNAATGLSGQELDAQGAQPGFGQFISSTQGIDAYINLGSEGDPLHGAPGLVDLVTVNGLLPIDVIPIVYANAIGSTPSTLSLSIPLTVFSDNQISLLDTGDFSVVVGNINNATDFLPSASVIPEPSSILLLALGFVVSRPALRAFAKGNRAAPLA
jgi:hypothetical protein